MLMGSPSQWTILRAIRFLVKPSSLHHSLWVGSETVFVLRSVPRLERPSRQRLGCKSNATIAGSATTEGNDVVVAI